MMAFALRPEKTKLGREEEEVGAGSSYVQEACQATLGTRAREGLARARAVTVKAGRIDHLFDLLRRVLTTASNPIGDQPYLRCPLRLQAADSSIKTS